MRSSNEIKSNIYAAITEPSIIPETPDWESFAPDDPYSETITDTTFPASTELIYDTARPLFTDAYGNPVYFSAGSGVSDPLAESLARALRAAEIHNPARPFDHNEVPLHDLDEAEAEDESADQFSGASISYWIRYGSHRWPQVNGQPRTTFCKIGLVQMRTETGFPTQTRR